MTWYLSEGPDGDIAVSGRIRLARNLREYPFPARLSKEGADEIIEKVWGALSNSPLQNDLRLFKMSELSPSQKKALTERHLISPELAKSALPAAAIISGDENISIMVNEEDHIRIQTFSAGLTLKETYDLADKLDVLLSEHLNFCYHDKFGFLTACPTNAGTGLRASLMLHLPAITASNNLNNILSWAGKLGLTVRGLFGEGTQASGQLYQLSNQVTMGAAEEDIVERLIKAARELCGQERLLQSKIFEAKTSAITDRCMRARSVLLGAYLLKSAEVMSLISDVRFGINLGIINDIPRRALTRAMFLTMPANIAQTLADGADGESRDIARARYMREELIESGKE